MAMFTILSCEPNVMFKEAMPPGVEAIDRIPERFQGAFICESDSSHVYAEEQLILRESYYMFITNIDRVRESDDCEIVKGGILLPGRQECVPIEYLGEGRIKATVYTIDTLFSFQKDEVLKLYKGRLFVNYKNSLDEWVTFMISPEEDGRMKWDIIDVPDQIKRVKEITYDYDTRVDRDHETIYIIKPTLVEFDRILYRDYVTECDILTPIRINL